MTCVGVGVGAARGSQRFMRRKLACKAFAELKRQRLAVAVPLRPATCRFDWDFPMRRLFLSKY
jgi:hypothetical protein